MCLKFVIKLENVIFLCDVYKKAMHLCRICIKIIITEKTVTLIRKGGHISASEIWT